MYDHIQFVSIAIQYWLEAKSLRESQPQIDVHRINQNTWKKNRSNSVKLRVLVSIEFVASTDSVY